MTSTLKKYAGLLVLAIALFTSSCSSDAVVDKLLATTVEQMNKKCPMMVDEVTRWDNSVSLPGRVLQYNYTIVGLDKAQLDLTQVDKQLKPTLLNNIKTNPQMKSLTDKKVTFVYQYKDQNGVFVTKITITPEMYKS